MKLVVCAVSGSGTWKLVHRHEDPLIDKTAPAGVIQKAVAAK
jgi:hypothetical protein